MAVRDETLDPCTETPLGGSRRERMSRSGRRFRRIGEGATTGAELRGAQ